MGIEKGNGKLVNFRIEPSVKIRHNLAFFHILQKDEKNIFELLRKVEKDPLFRKLCGHSGFARVISFKKNSNSAFAWQGLSDENFPQGSIASFCGGISLESRERILKIIRSVGQAKFEKYFLGEVSISKEKVLKECGISSNEYRDIMAFLAAFFNAYENIPSSRLPTDCFKCVARVARERGRFVIEYLSLYYARGLYVINEKRLSEVKTSGLLSEDELNRIDSLLRQIEVINWRKKCIYKIIENLVKIQKPFFERRKTIIPLSQRRLAVEAGISPSSVSRIIRNKSLLLPWGEEMPLAAFFRKQKYYIINIIKHLRPHPGKKLTDIEICRIIEKKCGIKISRRSVNLYRRSIDNERNHRT